MNFTREPIIETIITPKDGYKLILRNTKGSHAEEYIVDAIEVVSYGHSFFFRSLERPKEFLVPVTDYEVIEMRDTKVMLKTPSIEKSVKIGGGKEATLGKEKEELQEEDSEKSGKKVERRRQRRKRVQERKESVETSFDKKVEDKKEGGDTKDETRVSSGTGSLIPPPSGLISDKYRIPKTQEIPQTDLFSSEIIEQKPESETERLKREIEEKIAFFPKDDNADKNVASQRPAVREVQEELDKVEPILQTPPAPDLFDDSKEEKESDSSLSFSSKSDKDLDDPVF